MALTSALSANRTVLLIADEALYVYVTSARATKLIEVVPWSTQYFEDVVLDLLRKDCGGKPVVILNDMTDLHFKGGQRMPKVSVMDKKNVLDRKLQVAFPNYPIRGALKIKKSKEELMDAAASGEVYLFAAVPPSEPIAMTLEAVKRSMVAIVGFFVLPIEATDMVDQLSRKIAGKDVAPSEWAIFLGQHQDGSLRQVITRYGQLAMTRMTPVGDADVNPDQWAADVAREFQATLSYLSRFGYSADKPVDVIVVANQEASAALEARVQVDGTLKSFSIFEAAKEVGLKLGDQVETRFADILHIAWCAKKSKFQLPMKLPDVDSVVMPRRIVTVATLLFMVASGYLGWQASVQMNSMVNVKSQIAQEKQNYAQADQDYIAALQVMEDLGLDIRLIKGALAAREGFVAQDIDFLKIIRQIGVALGNDLRLDQLAIQRKDTDASSDPLRTRFRAPTEQNDVLPVEVKMTLSFPPTIQLEAGIQEINQLRFRLGQALPDYEVEIVRQVARPEYTERVSGTVGGEQTTVADEDYTAEIVLKGPVQQL